MFDEVLVVVRLAPSKVVSRSLDIVELQWMMSLFFQSSGCYFTSISRDLIMIGKVHKNGNKHSTIGYESCFLFFHVNMNIKR